MKNKLLTSLTLFSLVMALSSSLKASDTEKIIINSYIGVEIGADIAQYEETLSLTRNQTRRMYMDEIVEAALKLSSGYFDPTGMLEPLQKISDAADRKRDINKEIDSVKIGFSVGEFFKSAIDKLHKANGITSLERKIEFANMFPVINGRMAYNSKVQYDHYVFIQMAHIGGGQFRMTGTLGTINNGKESYFEGAGYLEVALAQVAEGIFRSIMETERPAWINPHPTLNWIAGPVNMSSLDAKEARAYCTGQGARLPYSDELILANHATAFRKGGIERFDFAESYFVADLGRQAGVAYIVHIENFNETPVPTVTAVAGHRGKVWCVRGDISEKNEVILKLYSIRRKLDPQGVNIRFFPQSVSAKNLEAIKAIESLLIQLNAAGAELSSTLAQADLMDADTAISILSKAGFDLKISTSLLE